MSADKVYVALGYLKEALTCLNRAARSSLESERETHAMVARSYARKVLEALGGRE